MQFLFSLLVHVYRRKNKFLPTTSLYTNNTQLENYRLVKVCGKSYFVSRGKRRRKSNNADSNHVNSKVEKIIKINQKTHRLSLSAFVEFGKAFALSLFFLSFFSNENHGLMVNTFRKFNFMVIIDGTLMQVHRQIRSSYAVRWGKWWRCEFEDWRKSFWRKFDYDNRGTLIRQLRWERLTRSMFNETEEGGRMKCSFNPPVNCVSDKFDWNLKRFMTCINMLIRCYETWEKFKLLASWEYFMRIFEMIQLFFVLGLFKWFLSDTVSVFLHIFLTLDTLLRLF